MMQWIINIRLRKVFDYPTALRRKFYHKFRKDYVIKGILERKGSCDGCPMPCCAFALTPCKYYDKKDKCCLTYSEPEKCPKGGVKGLVWYPFDEKDMNPSSREWCMKQWSWE